MRPVGENDFKIPNLYAKANSVGKELCDSSAFVDTVQVAKVSTKPDVRGTKAADPWPFGGSFSLFRAHPRCPGP